MFLLDDALSALSHPARRELVRLCSGGERTVGALAEAAGLRQSTTSQHLKLLRQAGIMSVRADGNRRLYRVDFSRIEEIRAALDALWAQHER